MIQIRKLTKCIIIAILFASMACDPLIRIEGQIVDEQGVPIPNAELETYCKIGNGNRNLKNVSNEDGNFEVMDLGCLEKLCNFQVKKAGYFQESFNVGKNCVDTVWGCHKEKSCNRVQHNIILKKSQ